MPKFEWTDQHAVCVPEVDDEHRMLFQLCGDLEGAVAGGAPAGQIQAILDELIAHTAEHFSHEEREMRATGYSHYQWHQQQHHAASVKVTQLESRIRKGDRDAALELLEYFHGWLNDHIGIADRMLGAYLRNHQRERQARAS